MVHGLHEGGAARPRGLAAGHRWQTRLAVDHHPLWHRGGLGSAREEKPVVGRTSRTGRRIGGHGPKRPRTLS